jgi:hypothetical protein
VCYNDNHTSILNSEELIGCSSAYVLFYIRRDIQDADIDDLFQRIEGVLSHRMKII